MVLWMVLSVAFVIRFNEKPEPMPRGVMGILKQPVNVRMDYDGEPEPVPGQTCWVQVQGSVPRVEAPPHRSPYVLIPTLRADAALACCDFHLCFVRVLPVENNTTCENSGTIIMR